jgi:hypothetical protein
VLLPNGFNEECQVASGDVVADLGDDVFDECRDPVWSQLGRVRCRERSKFVVSADDVCKRHAEFVIGFEEVVGVAEATPAA